MDTNLGKFVQDVVCVRIVVFSNPESRAIDTCKIRYITTNKRRKIAR